MVAGSRLTCVLQGRSQAGCGDPIGNPGFGAETLREQELSGPTPCTVPLGGGSDEPTERVSMLDVCMWTFFSSFSRLSWWFSASAMGENYRTGCLQNPCFFNFAGIEGFGGINLTFPAHSRSWPLSTWPASLPRKPRALRRGHLADTAGLAGL